MIRQLVLLRHAEAMQPVSGQRDIERALSSNGQQQLIAVGESLASLPEPLQCLLASSATRTAETARGVCGACGITPGNTAYESALYDASAGALLTRLQSLDDGVASIVLVAHNPGISVLAHSLVRDTVNGFAPAGFAVISLECDWAELAPGIGRLVSQG